MAKFRQIWEKIVEFSLMGHFLCCRIFFCISLYFNLSVHALDTVSIVCLFKVQFPLEIFPAQQCPPVLSFAIYSTYLTLSLPKFEILQCGDTAKKRWQFWQKSKEPKRPSLLHLYTYDYYFLAREY